MSNTVRMNTLAKKDKKIGGFLVSPQTGLMKGLVIHGVDSTEIANDNMLPLYTVEIGWADSSFVSNTSERY